MNNVQTHAKSVGSGSQTQFKPVLKVAIDAHATTYVIATQIEGSAPKPPQRFDRAGLLRWVEKKLGQGFAVVTCYEAGPFGFWLHRQLVHMGVTSYVIRPRNWDDHYRGLKTDRSDARSMLSALDRFLAGNTHALTVVRVPAVEQERLRSESRVRESLQRQLKACAQRGRSLALQYGYELQGNWFGIRRWPSLELPDWLLKLLEPLRQNALCLWHLVAAQTAAVEQASGAPKPRGLGPLAEQILEREIGDWNRFKNRRQVSSFLGLCPGEHSSGSRQSKGAITKAGNARARVILVQIAWRLLVHQPGYRLVKKWRPHLVASKATTRRRKQIIVALARGFAVDWWRLRTRQTTPEQLGLVMNP
jgi:transposase